MIMTITKMEILPKWMDDPTPELVAFLHDLPDGRRMPLGVS